MADGETTTGPDEGDLCPCASCRLGRAELHARAREAERVLQAERAFGARAAAYRDRLRVLLREAESGRDRAQSEAFRRGRRVDALERELAAQYGRARELVDQLARSQQRADSAEARGEELERALSVTAGRLIRATLERDAARTRVLAMEAAGE